MIRRFLQIVGIALSLSTLCCDVAGDNTMGSNFALELQTLCYGQSNAAGTILSGSKNFTITKTGTGNFAVIPTGAAQNPAFQPSVIGNANSGDGTALVSGFLPFVSGGVTLEFQCLFHDAAGALADPAFWSFKAELPGNTAVVQSGS